MDLSTEEDIKIKLVCDYLKSLGFQQDELFFEHRLDLTLGGSGYKIDTGKQVNKASGRLDILVKRNGNNLFVLEIKSDQVEISENDIGQVTSYACLVRPPAPFSLITNGKEFRIYDSITRAEVLPGAFKIKDRYEVNLTEELRYEALKHFIGYSRENVKIFCRLQVSERMKTLLGSATDSDKQFVPDLYVERKLLYDDFSEFLTSPARVFPVIGDSGIGKTCFLCAAALGMVNRGEPVLFYRAIHFLGEIPKSIAEDFNWEFSSQYSSIQVIKRVAELFEPQPLVIFIDAVDEWSIDNKVNTLCQFLDRLKGRNVKLIASCKTNAWPTFLSQRGVPTELAEILKQDEGDHQLQTMTDEEFWLAVDKLRQFYNFNGLFESGALEECKRNPFLLRILFEVAQKHGIQNITLSSIDAFQEFYDRTLEKTGDHDRAEKILKAVAQSMLNTDLNYAEIDNVLKSLAFDGNATLSELINYNVLENNAGRLSFYFADLKNFVIAYKVLDLPHLESDNYESLLEGLQGNEVFFEAFKLFYSNAEREKQIITDGVVRRNAEVYLAFYVEILDRCFAAFRDSFEPQTKGSIGFIGEISLNRKKLTWYGFRELPSQSNELVKLIPTDQTLLSEPRSNLSYLHGAGNMHMTSSAGGFVNIDVRKEVLYQEIIPQLKEIVEHGALNESQNRYLLIEKVIAIIAKHYSPNLGIRNIRKLSGVLPIGFEKIECAIRYEIAYRFYEHSLIHDWRKSSKIKETRIGSYVSYSHSLSDDDRRNLSKLAANAAARNIVVSEPHVRYPDREKIERALASALSDLRRLGLNAIDETIIPDSDQEGFSRWIWGNYSEETLSRYIESLYLLFLDEYKTLVETNFSAHKELFTLYSQMPLKCLITIDRKTHDDDPAVDIFYLDGSFDENSVTMCTHDDIQYDFRTSKLKFQNVEYACRRTMLTGLQHFFGAHRSFVAFSIEEQLIPLRSLVYDQIKIELKPLVQQILSSYDQSDKPLNL